MIDLIENLKLKIENSRSGPGHRPEHLHFPISNSQKVGGCMCIDISVYVQGQDLVDRGAAMSEANNF